MVLLLLLFEDKPGALLPFAQVGLNNIILLDKDSLFSAERLVEGKLCKDMYDEDK